MPIQTAHLIRNAQMPHVIPPHFDAPSNPITMLAMMVMPAMAKSSVTSMEAAYPPDRIPVMTASIVRQISAPKANLLLSANLHRQMNYVTTTIRVRWIAVPPSSAAALKQSMKVKIAPPRCRCVRDTATTENVSATSATQTKVASISIPAL